MKSHALCVAPMMDWTDRHCRHFHRLLAPSAVLYTEMVNASAIVKGGADWLLDFSDFEQPVAVQLGGSDPVLLAEATKKAVLRGYNEINLNLGCPSDRVQSGQFGAVLMKSPDLVQSCLQAMLDCCDQLVSAKIRIGVDELDSEQYLLDYVGKIAQTGCSTLIVHARKAWLQGLSPKQNREIPELNYSRAYAIKKHFPELKVIVNGGIDTVELAADLSGHFDGIMSGRMAYHQPWFLHQLNKQISKAGKQRNVETISRRDILQKMTSYIESQLNQGVNLHHMTRHILGLFHGIPGARGWRRVLSTDAVKTDAGIEVVEQALNCIERIE